MIARAASSARPVIPLPPGNLPRPRLLVPAPSQPVSPIPVSHPHPSHPPLRAKVPSKMLIRDRHGLRLPDVPATVGGEVPDGSGDGWMLQEPVPVPRLVRDQLRPEWVRGLRGTVPTKPGNNNTVFFPRPDPKNGISASGRDKNTTIIRWVIASPFGNVCCRHFPVKTDPFIRHPAQLERRSQCTACGCS